eukprot:scaffold53913_cov67-Phaeocystis_antarctica.AAC.7
MPRLDDDVEKAKAAAGRRRCILLHPRGPFKYKRHQGYAGTLSFPSLSGRSPPPRSPIYGATAGMLPPGPRPRLRRAQQQPREPRERCAEPVPRGREGRAARGEGRRARGDRATGCETYPEAARNRAAVLLSSPH